MTSKNTIHDNYDFFADVEIKQTQLKELFSAATRTLAIDELLNDDTFNDEHKIERYMSLFWLHLTELQIKDEPRNELLQRSLADSQLRVDAILQPNGYPWELS